jgi:A/G-specific adenine glycosylase
MLQQTQVTTVIPFYEKFINKFPTVNALADANEQEVLKLWEGLGYYSRARHLLKAAQIVKVKYKGDVPHDVKEFQSLPGVGSYISAAVLSIAANKCIPVVDGNVLRVYTRFQGISSDILKLKTRQDIFKDLDQIIPSTEPGDFNQALMELGALVCKPKAPDCMICPLKQDCYAFSTESITRFPYKSLRKPVPEYNVSIGVIIRGHRFYIQRRPSHGHLGGLWEFPGGKSKEGETAEETLIRECKEESDVKVIVLKKLKVVRHVYTHFKIIMSIFICDLENNIFLSAGNLPFKWITINDLDKYPFPKANHKFFPELREYFKRSFLY